MSYYDSLELPITVATFLPDSTPRRAAALEALSHFPIVVDYSHAIRNASRQKRLVSAFKNPEPMCRSASNSTILEETYDLSSCPRLIPKGNSDALYASSAYTLLQ